MKRTFETTKKVGNEYCVAEQIYETATRKIPQIVWAESTSLIVPVYSAVSSQPPYEIHLTVNTALVLFSWSSSKGKEWIWEMLERYGKDEKGRREEIWIYGAIKNGWEWQK
jgi:hypothetical protein